MEARERARGLDEDLAPALDVSGSDSAVLDNALELLVRAGKDVTEAVTMLVPPAWQNDPRIGDEERALHRYHALLVEPWDGPAGLVYTDVAIAAPTGGSLTVKVEPWAWTLVTVRSPPIRRQKWRLIASPSPVPPYLLRVDASAWENASNSRPSCSSVIPIPVSATENVSQLSD